MLHAVIMAGGAGTRLWPESRSSTPKQLLNLQGDRTMIQATVDRLGSLVDAKRTWIATTEALSGAIADQLDQLPRESILCEPCPRNTAPCIALAAMRILRNDPEGIMAVMPSDHLITPPEVFQNALSLGESLVEEDHDRLITFGIRPTYPAESFGYIEREAPLSSDVLRRAATSTGVYRVKQFREKPDAPTARQYVDSGRFFWNAGIFLWKARTIWNALARYEPEMFEHLDRIDRALATPDHDDTLLLEFSAIRGKSIDYAVMERHPEVVVVEAEFSWDDVGSWRSLERFRPTDERGNLIDGERCLVLDSDGTIVRSHDPNHVVAVMGMKDLVVIHTEDATLVANKADEESIRQVIAALKERGWREHL